MQTYNDTHISFCHTSKIWQQLNGRFCYSQGFLHSAAETIIINPATENAETGEILYISSEIFPKFIY